MPKLMKTPLPVFYTVCLKKRDSFTLFHGLLYEVRRNFFDTSRKSKNKVIDSSAGIETHCSYAISRRNFKWKKKYDRKILELTQSWSEGYCILTYNLSGTLASKASYDRQHIWKNTSYFAEDDAERPQIMLEPLADCNGICMQEYNAIIGKYSKTEFYGCPIYVGTAQQSMVNSVAGEPQLCAATSFGDFCYCTQQELELRQTVAAEVESGSRS